MKADGSRQGEIESNMELSAGVPTDGEIQITQEEFSKLTYRQRYAVTEYKYLLAAGDAEKVGTMLGNFVPEKDILAFCQANGKKVYRIDKDDTLTSQSTQVKNPTKSKIRDLAVGFFGWFLAGNLIVALFGFLFYSVVLGALGVFALFTLGMIVYLFAQNRQWIGAGIIAALLTNGVFMALLGFGSLFILFIPLPVGLFLLMQ